MEKSRTSTIKYSVNSHTSTFRDFVKELRLLVNIHQQMCNFVFYIYFTHFIFTKYILLDTEGIAFSKKKKPFTYKSYFTYKTRKS